MISVRQALDVAWRHYQKGEWQQAEQLYLQVLEVDPHQVDALHLLAAISGQTGREGQAIDYLQTLLRLKPWFAAAHNNLGNALAAQKRFPEAVVSFQQAVRLQPAFAKTHSNLGNALREEGRLAEAAASLEQAIRLDPESAEAHYNLGLTLMGQGQLDGALAAYRTALKLKPDAAHIHDILLFTLHYHPAYDAERISAEHRRWNELRAQPLQRLTQPHNHDPDPDRRLRIGYVSPDFREHVNSFFTIPLFSNHDHRQFEIICIADVARPDSVTERHRGLADVFRYTAGLSDEQVADLVRDDRVDILVDLAMHTEGNRLLMFARKPAPVQVTWLAYPGSTGLSAIDYRLTDPHLDPPGLFDAFYAEASLRLPETYWCYDPLSDQPPVNALPATANGAITFGCLNSFCKVNDDNLVLWSRVLRQVPHSRLLMHAPCDQARERILAKLTGEGVAPSKVEFANRLSRQEYLRLYHRIDVALDPLPCNGAATTLDALWMGVPVLTLIGKTVVGRAGWSLLCNLGLNDLAAETPDQFVAQAVRLTGDLRRLEELRSTLRQRLQRSPLMDANRFARNIEQAYRDMWRRWCQQTRRRPRS